MQFVLLAQLTPLEPSSVSVQPTPDPQTEALIQQVQRQLDEAGGVLPSTTRVTVGDEPASETPEPPPCAPDETFVAGECHRQPVFERDSISSEGQLDSTDSVFWVARATPIAFGSVALLAAILFALTRSKARALREPPPGRVVVRGTVEGDPSRGPVVRCELRQQGREWQGKGGWSHQWTEVDRRYTVAPFEVRTERGDLVRVEPDANPMLVSLLTETLQHDRVTRTRVAHVKPGDAVTVIGAQTATGDPRAASLGYRGSAEGTVLRAPRGGRMIVATEALDEAYGDRAALHRNWAVTFASLLLGVNALFYAGYWARFADGRPTLVTVTERDTYITRSKNGASTHYRIRGTGRIDGEEFTVVESINPTAYARIRPGDRVPFLVVRGNSTFTEPGTTATVNGLCVVFVGIIFAGFAFGYAGHASATSPWYWRRRWHDVAGGKLDDPAQE